MRKGWFKFSAIFFHLYQCGTYSFHSVSICPAWCRTVDDSGLLMSATPVLEFKQKFIFKSQKPLHSSQISFWVICDAHVYSLLPVFCAQVPWLKVFRAAPARRYRDPGLCVRVAGCQRLGSALLLVGAPSPGPFSLGLCCFFTFCGGFLCCIVVVVVF